MESKRGMNRGSFLWGRSVHNIRIERLWVDVTRGFGSKWKDFFTALEVYSDLDPSNEEHLWLLHFLFLNKVNQDAALWQKVWNEHRLKLPEGGRASPSQLWYFGQLQKGARGLSDALWDDDDDYLRQDATNDGEEDEHYEMTPEEGGGHMYGVDWTDMDTTPIVQHLRVNHPENMAEVIVEDPACPLNAEGISWLQAVLAKMPDTHSQEGMTLVWEKALEAFERIRTHDDTDGE
ncbi:hypothetical protein CALVIDRAFT_544596 [Calocera viscosa TUFC12733]|uniref:Integrase core domain-containing protein n=1 Tax=Calocera viscosa (strain TUFC12733) TaxID=1330018 RepID=A0A167PX97_CALVF|nr:hypothetical protein CALVIDRAFT_544596 [Calocera viscosa TUFC12733]